MVCEACVGGVNVVWGTYGCDEWCVRHRWDADVPSMILSRCIPGGVLVDVPSIQSPTLQAFLYTCL